MKYGSNAARMSSGLLAKSMTNVLRFCSPPAVRWVRLSRERVWTAVTPESFLSTYIAESRGWSKPVWNLLATSMILYVSPLNAAARSEPAPGLRLASVNSSSLPGCGPQSVAHSSFSAMLTDEEKATRVR